MDMRKLLTGFLLAAVLGAAAACNNGGVTPVTPSGPTNPAVTDTFSDNIGAGLSATHSFTTTQAGEVDVTLTAETAASGSNIPLLVGLGNVSADGVTCSLSSTTVQFLQLPTTPALPPVTTATSGTFCFTVADYYTLGPVTYTINVTHH